MAFDPGPLFDLLEAGGLVMWIIAGLSIVAVTLIAGKLLEFWLGGLWRRRAVEHAVAEWQSGRPDAALARIAEARGPVGEVVAVAMRGRRDAAMTDAMVREEVARRGAALLERLRLGLRPLELIGTLAPLLGLLGTVLGMIDAFRELEAAGSRVDPAVLSGGIWVALLTTAGGLSVAIPAVAAHVWLERQVERAHHAMQDAATRVFTRGGSPGDGAVAAADAATEEGASRGASVTRLAGGSGAD